MKRSLTLGLLWLCLAGGSLAVAGGPPDSPGFPLRTVQLLASGQPVRIVCFGDSITGVYYHTGNRRAWCDLVGMSLLQLYPHARLEMINAGVSGNTTADALRRMDADVLSHNPQLVLVMFGMNDVARVAPGDFRANLRLIVQRARQHGAEVVLLTPNLVAAGDPLMPVERVTVYAGITREVGRELQVPVTDTFGVFAAVQTGARLAWIRLMSDAIHPNMRGHRMIAEEAVLTLTGQRVPLGPLPRLEPGLPWLLARLQAHQPVRVVAMKPYDALIGPALRKVFPDARVEVIAWDPTGKSLEEIETQAKGLGWAKYRAQPDLPRPDLFVVAVPAEAQAANVEQFYRSYTWTMNWSLSFARPAWDCLVILPSVASPAQDAAQSAAETLAVDVIQGQDLPWLQRPSGDSASAAELLERELARLLAAHPP